MKKVLLATSALVAFGGAASAEIAFSGYARFGAQYTEGTAGSAFVQGTINNTATTGHIARVTALNGGTALANFATAAGNTAAADITAIDGLITSLATTLATAEAARAAAITATGAAAASGTGSDAAVTTAAANLAEAQAIRAAIDGTAAVAAVADALNIDQRFNIDVKGSMESDNGLAFGAKVRMRAEEAGDNGTVMTINGARYFVSAGGMELAVGNIYGAIDSMSGLYAGSVGLTGLGWGNVVSNFGSQTYSSRGAGVNGVELIYSAGDLTMHVSTVKDAATEVAVSYSMNGITLALAGSNSDVATDAEWVATVGGSFGAASVGLALAQTVAGNNSMTLSGSFKVGDATTVSAYVAQDEAQADDSAYGIGVVHNLGGGASIRGGIANTHGTNRADLGVQFNF